MNDLISRQAAIDVADSADYTGLPVEDVKKVTDEVVKEIKQLPSAQPNVHDLQKDADYISRQAAIDAVCRACSCGDDYMDCVERRPESTFCDELVALRGVPSAQPEPPVSCDECTNFNKTRKLIEQPERKKGKWMPITKGERGYSAGDFRCDQCGTPNPCYRLTSFCPNCGADMRGEQE